MGVECKGTVLTSRESPQNKRDPSKGGHWIVELEVEEWSASDASTKPAEPVRLIVPRPVALALATPPAVGERFEVRANLVDGPTVTARVETLSPLDG
ncbi:MAG: hypothetical protein KC912_10570 [Proteobacteria bacterium]|nr:hypothetical protein [Pseudomonadota bacterium]